MVLLTIPVILLSFLGSFKAMSWLSIPSIIIAIMGMITILSYSIERISDTTRVYTEEVKLFDMSAMLGRIGVIMHIFGSPAVINVQNEA